jgi:hypothetical protein
MKRPLAAILVIFSLTLLCGCSEPLTTTEKGAGIGTVTGAGLGAIIGSATGHAGAGAGIGAAVGLIGGALIGDQIQERQKQEQELQQQMAAQQAEIDRAEQELQQLKQHGSALESGWVEWNIGIPEDSNTGMAGRSSTQFSTLRHSIIPTFQYSSLSIFHPESVKNITRGSLE